MSNTPQRPYDTKPDYGNLLQKHREYPLKRLMDLVSSKVDDLVDLVDRPSPFDQGPGKTIPYCIPVLYGPIPLTTAGRASNSTATLVGQDGFQTLAALANPAKYIVPVDGDILIGREFSFRGLALSAYGFVNWGYKSNPGFSVPYTNPNGVGGIFDEVGPDPSVGPNGGAMPLDFFGGTFGTLSTVQPNLPNIAFEVDLYDKIRGRRLHEKRLPVEMFQGGRIANRRTASALAWEKGSKIEPRLYVTEVRMGSILDAATAYNAASVKAWVCLVFKGVQQIEVPNV